MIGPCSHHSLTPSCVPESGHTRPVDATKTSRSTNRPSLGRRLCPAKLPRGVQHARQRVASHAQHLRRLRDPLAKRLQAVLPDATSGMRRVLHKSLSMPSTTYPQDILHCIPAHHHAQHRLCADRLAAPRRARRIPQPKHFTSRKRDSASAEPMCYNAHMQPGTRYVRLPALLTGRHLISVRIWPLPYCGDAVHASNRAEAPSLPATNESK